MQLDSNILLFLTFNLGLVLVFSWCGLKLLSGRPLVTARLSRDTGEFRPNPMLLRYSPVFIFFLCFRRKENPQGAGEEPPYRPLMI